MAEIKKGVLRVRNFAQVRDVNIRFGDLTVLVGPQASGKSIVLQLLKLAIDLPAITSRLHDYGVTESASVDQLLSVYFGEGYEKAWKPDTEVTWQGAPLKVRQRYSRESHVFFVPAQRVMVFGDGWPKPFSGFLSSDPYVAREFSESLRQTLSVYGPDGVLFPQSRVLKGPIRRAIADSVFHQASVGLKVQRQQRNLALRTGDGELPFMGWSAGQREFTPLVLSLYSLLPGGGQSKQPEINWVIIEEPEMGLHPMAVNAAMLLILELLHRKYRVVISSHSPHVLDLVWAIRTIQQTSGKPRHVSKLFDPSGRTNIDGIAKTVLKSKLKTYCMTFSGSKVDSMDISNLDPGSDNELIAGWGGLTKKSSEVSAVVAEAVSQSKSS